jgi:hypothetical protein
VKKWVYEKHPATTPYDVENLGLRRAGAKIGGVPGGDNDRTNGTRPEDFRERIGVNVWAQEVKAARSLAHQAGRKGAQMVVN